MQDLLAQMAQVRQQVLQQPGGVQALLEQLRPNQPLQSQEEAAEVLAAVVLGEGSQTDKQARQKVGCAP